MDIKRVLVKKPLVEFKLQSDKFYPATLLKCYEFSLSVDHFLSLNKVKKKMVINLLLMLRLKVLQQLLQFSC